MNAEEIKNIKKAIESDSVAGLSVVLVDKDGGVHTDFLVDADTVATEMALIQGLRMLATMQEALYLNDWVGTRVGARFWEVVFDTYEKKGPDAAIEMLMDLFPKYDFEEAEEIVYRNVVKDQGTDQEE